MFEWISEPIQSIKFSWYSNLLSYNVDPLTQSYEKALCYFPRFEQAIDKISRLKMNKSEYTSIQGYISEFETVNNNLIKFIKEAWN